MIKRVGIVLGWLLAGHALWAALYWLLLQVPESNALMLGASALLVVTLAWWIGVVESAALLAFSPGGTLGPSIATAARRGWMVFLPLLIAGGAWLLTDRFAEWIARHGSEIDAWVMLKTGSTKGQIIGTALRNANILLRWGIGLSLATALLEACARSGLGAARSTRWLKTALHWQTLLAFAVAYVSVFVVPTYWLSARWLPEGWAGTTSEVGFVSLKLGLTFVWGNLVWLGVLLVMATRSERNRA